MIEHVTWLLRSAWTTDLNNWPLEEVVSAEDEPELADKVAHSAEDHDVENVDSEMEDPLAVSRQWSRVVRDIPTWPSRRTEALTK